MSRINNRVVLMSKSLKAALCQQTAQVYRREIFKVRLIWTEFSGTDRSVYANSVAAAAALFSGTRVAKAAMLTLPTTRLCCNVKT